jgi:hypothetical protein
MENHLPRVFGLTCQRPFGKTATEISERLDMKWHGPLSPGVCRAAADLGIKEGRKTMKGKIER